MRNVIDCIKAFIPVLSTEYELVLGRKGVAVTLRILFDKKDCFHLMENNMESRNLFLFLSNDEGDNYFCRSFFPEEKTDYAKKQASWTLLYKKKIDLKAGTETVLYDRLK